MFVLPSAASGDFPKRADAGEIEKTGRRSAGTTAAGDGGRLATRHARAGSCPQVQRRPRQRAALARALSARGSQGTACHAGDWSSVSAGPCLAGPTAERVAERCRSFRIPDRPVDHRTGGPGNSSTDRRALPSSPCLAPARSVGLFLAMPRATGAGARRAQNQAVVANRLAGHQKNASRSGDRCCFSTNPGSP